MLAVSVRSGDWLQLGRDLALRLGGPRDPGFRFASLSIRPFGRAAGRHAADHDPAVRLMRRHAQPGRPRARTRGTRMPPLPTESLSPSKRARVAQAGVVEPCGETVVK